VITIDIIEICDIMKNSSGQEWVCKKALFLKLVSQLKKNAFFIHYAQTPLYKGERVWLNTYL